MAKKKSVRKNVKKSKKAVHPPERKFGLVLKNLVLFAVLSIVAFFLFKVSEKEMYVNLFFMIALISGFLAVAFLIVLLIFAFLKILKNK